MSTIKPTQQIDFVSEHEPLVVRDNTTNTKVLTEAGKALIEKSTIAFNDKLIKQKALASVKTISDNKMLELLKSLVVKQAIEEEKRCGGGLPYDLCITTLKACIGWSDMTIEQQTKINDYLNN
tara:strand:+ start:1865 stop:2233 length:369 start_codon:yes stop_codon:yes gene_type:complete